MLTRNDKIGLVLALLLGLADVAIVFALTADNPDDRPSVGIVVASVVVGVATIVCAAMAWRAPTRALVLGVVVTRAISALGDLAGLFAGGSVAVISGVLLVVSIVCLALLWHWVLSPTSMAGPTSRHPVG